MWTREALVEHLRQGAKVDFLFFWGHTPKTLRAQRAKDLGSSRGRVFEPPRTRKKTSGATDASCLSQWFPARFEVDGIPYATAEHFMMAEKARLFGDAAVLAQILASKSPADAKALGRRVKDYDDAAWGQARSESVVRGNVAKFSQNERMGAFLKSTREHVLVEASPRDRVWGIGMGASNPDARDPSRWKGQNLLGFALMEARARIWRSR